MLTVLAALVPIFLIIALGWTIKRLGFPNDSMWPPLERLVYFILFPSLIFNTLATAEFSNIDVWPMGAALLTAILVMVGLLTLMRGRLTLTGAEYSSLFQGAVRWNGFIGLAAAASLFGFQGTTLVAVAIAFMVPTVNVLSVYILTRHAGDEPARIGTALNALVRNPLILACLFGILLNASGLQLAAPLQSTAEVLGRSALPLGLLAVGAALDLSHARSTGRTLALGTGLKLLGMPLLVTAACWAYDVEGITRSVAILCAAVPGATSSYVLARQLGGDATMMANMITGTTLGALVTMPVILALVL